MKYPKLTTAIVVLAVVAIGYVGIHFLPTQSEQDQQQLGNFSFGPCIPTQTKVAIGNQASTVVISSSTVRTWASIQQPANATNTVSLAFARHAVSGSGYSLTPTTTPEFSFGSATLRPYLGMVFARTDAGSTTVNVLECK